MLRLVKSIFASNPSISEPHTGPLPIAELERQISLTNKSPENLPPAGLDSVLDDIISTNEPLASPAPSRFSNDINLASDLSVSPTNPAPSTVHSNQSEPLHGASLPPLRQSLISWHSTKPPPTSYTSVRGDPAEDGKGYVLECTIFAHSGSPNPTQGRLGDIYLDTASNLAYTYVPGDTTSRWQIWNTTSQTLRHPLLPEYRLYCQRNHGIKWGTDNAIKIENSRVGNSPEIPASVQKTIAYHKQLDPQFDGKSIRSRRRVIDNPNRVKKEGDVNQSQRVQSEKTKGNKRRRGKDGTEETIDESDDEERSTESAKTSVNKRRGKERSKETVDESRDEERSTKRLKIYIPKEKLATLNRIHTYHVPSTPPFPAVEADLPMETTPSTTVPTMYQRLQLNPLAWLKRAGIEFPAAARTIQWVSGIFTVVPWAETDKENKPNPDIAAVEHMSQAPDVTISEQIYAIPGDPRVNSFIKDPVLIVMEWTDELKGPQSNRPDVDITGYSKEEEEAHRMKYDLWMAELKRNLAAGRTVVVRGWYPNSKITWVADSIAKFKGSMNQKIEYQDATVRARTYYNDNSDEIHVKVPFHTFITNGLEDPENSGNCLDSPGLRAEYPPFILSLADCTRSLELTRFHNGMELPICTDHESVTALPEWLKQKKRSARRDTKTKCGLCRDIEAMMKDKIERRNKALDAEFGNVTRPDGIPLHHKQESTPIFYEVKQDSVPKEGPIRLGWGGHIKQVFTKFGPTVFAWDTWTSCLWDLFTHAGFFTYVHHDAAGFATYAFIRHGCKIWGIHRPKITEDHKTRRGIFDVFRRILRPHGVLDYMQLTELYTFHLMMGDVLIQPPNSIHQVYTPVNCIASGGHFYNWCMLHLTEFSRRFDHYYSHLATNADHPCAFRTICRMAMSLPYVCKTRVFLRRPILALILMILKPMDYETHILDSSSRTRLPTSDTLRLETKADHNAAIWVVTAIMNHHSITLEDIEQELDIGGVDWAKAGDKEIDLSFLEGQGTD